MLTAVMVQSFSDGIAIRSVRPLALMTSYFHAMGPLGQNKARRYISKTFAMWRYQLDVGQLQCSVEFIKLKHRGRSLL